MTVGLTHVYPHRLIFDDDTRRPGGCIIVWGFGEGQAHLTGEDIARAHGDHAKLHILHPAVQEAVHRLPDGAIAARHNDAFMAIQSCFFRQLAGMSLAFRHPHTHLPSRPRERFLSTGKGELPLRTSGDGIADDNGFHSGKALPVLKNSC